MAFINISFRRNKR